MTPNLEKNLTTLIRLAIAVLILLIIYLALVHVLPVASRATIQMPVYFLPFILALILAILTDPLTNLLENKLKLPRGLATFLSLVAVWGGITVTLFLIISHLVGELSRLYRYLSGLSEGVNLAGLLEKIEHIYSGILPSQSPLQEGVQKNIDLLLDLLQTLVQTSIDYIVRLAAALPGVFTIFLIATVATYFMIRDKKLIVNTLIGFVPTAYRQRLRGISHDLGSALFGFLRAELILISITGFQTVFGLVLLKVPYAVTIGILVGLFDIMPVIGPGAIFLPWAAGHLYLGNYSFAIGLLILYGIITAVRQLLEPKILAESIGLHPLATLVSLYVGLKAMGAVGVVLGPVVLVVYKAMKKARLLPRWFLQQDR